MQHTVDKLRHEVYKLASPDKGEWKGFQLTKTEKYCKDLVKLFSRSGGGWIHKGGDMLAGWNDLAYLKHDIEQLRACKEK